MGGSVSIKGSQFPCGDAFCVVLRLFNKFCYYYLCLYSHTFIYTKYGICCVCSLVGATTLEEYKLHIEKDAAFCRRFQNIVVEAPQKEKAICKLFFCENK